MKKVKKMNKFEIRSESSTTQKAIRFSNNTINRVEDIMKDCNCTFSDFVRDSIEITLDKLEKDKNKLENINQKINKQKAIRLSNNLIDRVEHAIIGKGLNFSTFVRKSVERTLDEIENDEKGKFRKTHIRPKNIKAKNKGIWVSSETIERIENAIVGNECTFSGFVVSSVKWALKEWENTDIMKNLNKYKSINGKFYECMTIRFPQYIIDDVCNIVNETQFGFGTFVRCAVELALKDIE